MTAITKKVNDLYAECKHIQRTQPEYIVNDEIAKEIGRQYRTLPTFEKGLYEHVYKNHYSLERNEYLKCRWKAYKKNIENRIFAPFQFPDHSDLHFHNCAVRFMPNLSIRNVPNFRKKLKPGPGVDYGGQMPIPEELQLKRGIEKNKKKETNHPKIVIEKQRNST
ncbi:hypothetical protein K1T71_014624 [Dendrolimus kikuchii]|uniref:Uncharacterized protein n=1 Tax=Dendrolimus kikuchii TaxID=765133 RepID=A0ACC1CEN0_9NEOP|nr:hypothetical protein K1T71_014624 [Dendrolimus kikuchii]